MTFLALLILGILWSVLLLPPLMRRVPAMASLSAKDPVSGFSNQLSRLERPVGAAGVSNRADSSDSNEALLPVSSLAAARRRRDVVGSLFALALFTLIASTVLGRPALIAHIVVDLVLIAFLAAMYRRSQLRSSPTAVVTQLPTRTRLVMPTIDAEQFRKSG